MSDLSLLVRKRISSGQGALQSLGGSLKDKLKEKMDPRRMLNQKGLLVSLFPGLKAFSPTEQKLNLNVLESSSKLDVLKINTKITAKNISALPEIARDVNVSKNNLIKFIKLIGKETPAKKTDMFFTKQSEMELLYENKKREEEDESKVSRLSKKSKLKSGLLGVLGVIGITGLGLLTFDFLTKGENSFVAGLFKKMKDYLSKTLTSFSVYIYDNITKKFEDTWKSLKEQSQSFYDEVMEDIDEFFTVQNFIDMVTPGKETDLLSGLSKKMEKFKTDMSETLNNFSILPEAKASIMPSSIIDTQERSTSPSRPVTEKTSGLNGLLETIARGEGTSDIQAQQRGFASGYDVVYGYGQYVKPEKPISEMTVGEVKQFQRRQIRATTGKIPGTNKGTGAVGKYQITQTTLQGLQNELGFSDQQKFSPKFQELLAAKLLERRGLKTYLSGKISMREFQNNLAKEWASIAIYETGKSAYGQATGTSSSNIQKILSTLGKTEKPQSVSNGKGDSISLNLNGMSEQVAFNDSMSTNKIKTVIITSNKNNTIFVKNNQKTLEKNDNTAQLITLVT
jgi:muramidase (phage lysozyme)